MKFFTNNFNIAKYYDCFYDITNSSFKIIFKMNFFEENLTSFLYKKENPIVHDLFWIFDTLFKIANSVKILHHNEFLYRNLQPRNIQFLNEYTPILWDLAE